MDANKSYFVRTLWFIWIGYTASLTMLGLLGFLRSLDTPPEGAGVPHAWKVQFLVLAVLFSLASIPFWKKAKQAFRISKTQDSDSAVGASAGMGTLHYTTALSFFQVVGMAAFIIGYLKFEPLFIAPFLGAALLLNFLHMPSRLL